MPFGSDRVLLYDVKPWNDLGFAVPNFGDNIGTVSVPLWNLADEIGRTQLFLMVHADARRTQPPSRNTIERIGRLLNRVHSVFAARQKAENELLLEEGHATANPKPWNVHPVPYFSGSMVRNQWLREYNELTMYALTNLYQHSDNNRALTVTKKLAQQVYAFFREIKILMGTTLLGLKREDVEVEGFLFGDQHYAAYAPSDSVINYEALDNPGLPFSLPTEDDLNTFFTGIPANLIGPLLKQYPVGGLPGALGYSGENLPTSATVYQPGATAPAGGTIGAPANAGPAAVTPATGAAASGGGNANAIGSPGV